MLAIKALFCSQLMEQNASLKRMKYMDLSAISDDELLGKVSALAETERFTLADFLIHLGELGERDACQRRGYSSVFAYLTRRLGYAESDAIRRVRAARAARLYPPLLRLLAAGELHLVGIALLEPFLTQKNHRGLIQKACGKSQREIERMIAALSPAAAEPRDRIRALPSPAPTAKHAADPVVPEILPGLDSARAMQYPEPAPSAERLERREPDRRLFTFAADERVHEWFLQARDLLRHKFPAGRMEEIIGEALKRLIEQELPGGGPRRRRGTARESAPKHSRGIPRWVQDEVWRRDGGRCAYRGPGGEPCGETGWLEYDHVFPFARGGSSDDPANVRLLCRAHNQAEGRRLFGGRRTATAKVRACRG